MYKNGERFVKAPVPFQGSLFIIFFFDLLSFWYYFPYVNHQDEPSSS